MRKNLLLISAISPLPRDSGGAVRMYFEIKELSKYFNIYFIFFVEKELSEVEKKEIKKYVKEYWIIIKKNKSIFDFFIYGIPYWFSDWNVKEIDHILGNVLNHYKIDVVQIEFPPLLHLVKFIDFYKIKNIKKIYVAHDIAFISFWRRLKSPTIGFIRRIVHFLRFLEILFYEIKYLRKYDLIVTMSETDKKYIKFINKPTLVVPNGIERVNFIKTEKRKSFTIGYIGSFNHPPNRDAVVYMITKILPKILEKLKNAKFFVYGKNDKNEISNFLFKVPKRVREAVVFKGYVENLDEIYRSIDVLAAPLLSGSGTRIKILEALSYGIPVVTTSIGAEGLEKEKFSLLYIENNENKFADKVVTLLKNKPNNDRLLLDLKRKLRKHTWIFIFRNYYNKLINYY